LGATTLPLAQATSVVHCHKGPTKILPLIILVPSFPPQRCVAQTQSRANTMIMERGARPDALPKPKRGGAVLVGVVGVAMGLVLGLGAGVGLGASLNTVGALGATHTNHAGVGVLSAHERFVACSTSDADEISGPEELEAMLERWQARGAEPKWGTP
jgi:hypothetical protein